MADEGNVELRELTYDILFSAPERDGAIISVRVHKIVKEVLQKIASEEGLDGVSELVRNIIASYLIGKLNLTKPEPKVLTPPMYVNINVNKSNGGRQYNPGEAMLAKLKVDEKIEKAYDFLKKYKLGLILVGGNNTYVKRIKREVIEAIALALKYGLEDEYSKLKELMNELQAI